MFVDKNSNDFVKQNQTNVEPDFMKFSEINFEERLSKAHLEKSNQKEEVNIKNYENNRAIRKVDGLYLLKVNEEMSKIPFQQSKSPSVDVFDMN